MRKVAPGYAVRARREPEDARDVALDNRSPRVAYRVPSSPGFVVRVIEPAIFFGPLTAPHDAGFVALLAAQAFPRCLVIAEIVRFALLSAGCRRGF